MNHAIVCKPSPVKTLSVSSTPLRELLNFLIYGRYSELLTERARRQVVLSLIKIPSTARELKEVLGAERLDKNGKLFFDCETSENQIAVLLDNQGAQFWVHYFRCGIGLVNLSFFSHLASAEGALTNQTRNVTHGSLEYQWFTHSLSADIFSGEMSEAAVNRLGDYFVEIINPTLVYPYSIYTESPKIKEPYKFVSGSLERLTEVLTWTRFVCEGLKRDRDPHGKTYVSPHMSINCGNLKDAPTFERATEVFINSVGAVTVKENAPYTVLHEGYGRRAGGESFDWARKNKHRIFLNLEQNKREVPVCEKIAARTRLVDWLKEQDVEGERILRTWKL
ncbi:MAG: hypothetical protein H0W58_10965 [Acidobacteria bacterium]|nr:hypothetical protein [Acidobacteriota bacterium]